MVLSNQATIDRFSATRRENEELKLSLDGCVEEKKQLQAKLTKLEQANKNLSENMTSLQEQVNAINCSGFKYILNQTDK